MEGKGRGRDKEGGKRGREDNTHTIMYRYQL